MKKKVLLVLAILFCGAAAYSETVIDFTTNMFLCFISGNYVDTNIHPVESLVKIDVGNEFSLNSRLSMSVGGGIGVFQIVNLCLYGRGELDYLMYKGKYMNYKLTTALSTGVAFQLYAISVYFDEEVSIYLQANDNKGIFGGIKLITSELYTQAGTLMFACSVGPMIGVKF